MDNRAIELDIVEILWKENCIVEWKTRYCGKLPNIVEKIGRCGIELWNWDIGTGVKPPQLGNQNSRKKTQSQIVQSFYFGRY